MGNFALRHHGRSLLVAALVAATPALADLDPSQQAELAVIQFEIRLQGAAWATQGGDDALAVRFIKKETFKLPDAFLQSCWPYGPQAKPPAEPPFASRLFPDPMTDLQDKAPGVFVMEFLRDLGSLGLGNADGSYAYLEASRMPLAESEAVGDALYALYGGRKETWRQAAAQASAGIQKLAARAVRLLTGHLGEEVAFLKAGPPPADATVLAVVRTLGNLDRQVKETRNLYDRCDQMYHSLKPLGDLLKGALESKSTP